jgi:hypothetical protein
MAWIGVIKNLRSPSYILFISEAVKKNTGGNGWQLALFQIMDAKAQYLHIA